MVNISTFSIRIVKEKSGRYDLEKYICSPKDVVNLGKAVLQIDTYTEEVFAMITLNVKNKVTGVFEVSRGSLNTTVAHPREIYKRALLQNAASIIVFHNHPSGNPEPSKEDIDFNNRLCEVGKIIGIPVLDNIIIGDGKYVSLKERGII